TRGRRKMWRGRRTFIRASNNPPRRPKALLLGMPSATVVRRVHFNAAHRLHNPDRSAEWNRATFGPCNNPNYHGHNYEVELCVDGEIQADTGYVVDVGIVKALFDEHVHAQLDH